MLIGCLPQPATLLHQKLHSQQQYGVALLQHTWRRSKLILDNDAVRDYLLLRQDLHFESGCNAMTTANMLSRRSWFSPQSVCLPSACLPDRLSPPVCPLVGAGSQWLSHLQRGTGQSDVVQLLACRFNKHHIFLHR